MSKAILRLIKPLNRPQPRINPAVKILISPQIKDLANEICEILRSEDKQWEGSLQNRFFEEGAAPSEVTHLVFDKIRDWELGLKFHGFVSRNSFPLDGLAYSSLLKLLARSRVVAEIDGVLSECLECEEKRPTHEALGVLIRTFAEAGLVSRALELFSYTLRNYDTLPQLLACNSLLNGLVNEGKLEKEKEKEKEKQGTTQLTSKDLKLPMPSAESSPPHCTAAYTSTQQNTSNQRKHNPNQSSNANNLHGKFVPLRD